jgi:hypothetical protein
VGTRSAALWHNNKNAPDAGAGTKEKEDNRVSVICYTVLGRGMYLYRDFIWVKAQETD